MLADDVITGLPFLKVEEVRRGHGFEVICRLEKRACCPRCGGEQLRLKDKKLRSIKGITHGNVRSDLLVLVSKYRCQLCGRTFWQEIPGVRKYSRTSQPLKEELFAKHIQGISQKQLAEDLAMGSASCERYVQEMFSLKYRERLGTPAPRVLGIDEHHFGRGQSFVTTLCDLRKHKVYDILPGKAESALQDHLERIPDRSRVKIVVMDLSSSYRSLVQRYFPTALIVSDRFHVIRLLLRAFSMICQRIDPSLKWQQRGLPKLMLKNQPSLTQEQRHRLQAYFKKQAAIHQLYLFKEEAKRFLMTRNKSRKALQKEGVIGFFLKLVAQLKASGFDLFRTLGKTLQTWQEEILRMFVFPYSNGITEGFHRKMKLIQRRAYGFRNFENYRLRVIVLCGHLPQAGL
jgi:transposase